MWWGRDLASLLPGFVFSALSPDPLVPVPNEVFVVLQQVWDTPAGKVGRGLLC